MDINKIDVDILEMKYLIKTQLNDLVKERDKQQSRIEHLTIRLLISMGFNLLVILFILPTIIKEIL